MTKPLDRMARATQLVRQGRLDEATALLQGTNAKTGKANAAPNATARLNKVKADPGSLHGRLAGNLGRLGGLASGRNPLPDMDDLRAASVLARAKRGSGASPVLAPGARYEWRTHKGPHGSRRYRLYVPAATSVRAMPLVVMLHGCTQDADDFAAGTRICEAAERHGFMVVLPEQPRDANPMGCWNWFEPAHQDAKRGEPAIIAGIVDEVARGERIDRARIVVAGLSAGGAMAATLGATRPDLFSGVAVHSGLPHGSARDTASAFAVMRSGGRAGRAWPAHVRLFVVQGDADATVAPVNADALLSAVGGTVRKMRDGGMTVTDHLGPNGEPIARGWRVPGLAHAWSGGARGASYTSPNHPDATAGLIQFLL